MNRPALRSWKAQLATLAGKALVAIMVVVASQSVTIVAWADHGSDQSEGTTGTFELLGELEHPPDTGIGIAAVDAPNRRLYGTSGGRFLAEYDLTTEVPKEIRSADLALPLFTGINTAPYMTSVDSEGQRLFTMSQNLEEKILVIDTEELAFETSFDPQKKVPGFSTMGMTYSTADDRLYLVGTFRTNALTGPIVTAFGYPAGEMTSVVALDATSGDVAWVRPIPECRMRPLNTQGKYGAPIFRSRLQPALYFMCASGLAAAGVQAGQSGVVRVSIDGEAMASDAASFDVDFYPVSGAYKFLNSNGIAGFDYGTDRFFIQSLSTTTPGTWVFDGRLETYVGFIAAPNNTNNLVAVNSSTGQYYMGMGGEGDEGGILVADGRATPVPQGIFDSGWSLLRPMYVDPGSKRLFIQDTPDGKNRTRVLRDLSSETDPSPVRNPDAITDDVPEGPNTTANFTNVVDGFGTAVTLIGGYESAVLTSRGETNVRDAAATVGEALSTNLTNPLELTYGDRGVLAGEVSGVTLTGFGATASAQALRPDEATEADREKRQNRLEDQQGGDEATVLDSPYPEIECSDGGEGRTEDAHTGKIGFAEVTVVCDLGGSEASASSSYQAQPQGTGISVSSSSFDGELRRDEALGSVAETLASSEGNRLAVGDGTALQIGSVRARSETVAHGRSGTSKARWVRTIEGVELVGPEGTTIYPREGEDDPTSCVTVIDATSGEEAQRSGSCQALVDGLNEILPDDKMKLRLPTPDVRATPKGALGQVRESDRDFRRGQTMFNDSKRDVPALEAIVYKDAEERSRVLVELASIQSSSIYTITQFQSFDGGGGPDLDFDAPGSSVPDGELSAPDLNAPELGADVDADEQLVSQLSGFLSNVDPSQLVDPPPVDQPAGASEPSGGSDMPADTGGVSSPPGMSTAAAPELGDGVDGGEPSPAVAAPADGPADTQGGDQAQAAGPTGTKMLARSAADAALVGGIWLLFLGAIAVVMRRASLLQLLGP